MTFSDAVRELAEKKCGYSMISHKYTPPPPASVNEPFDMKLVYRYHYDLLNNSDAVNMLKLRGVSLSMINEWKLGYKKNHWGLGESHVIPVLDGDKVLTIRHRLYNPPNHIGKYLPERKGDKAQLFGWQCLAEETVIVEGEFKAIIMNSVGIPTVGIMGMGSFREEFDARFCETVKRAYIMLDPVKDKAKGTETQQVIKQKWVSRLVNLGVECMLCVVKDKPDDLIIANGIEDVFSAMEYAERIKVNAKQNDKQIFHL
jgi:hypothetical protein